MKYLIALLITVNAFTQQAVPTAEYVPQDHRPGLFF